MIKYEKKTEDLNWYKNSRILQQLQICFSIFLMNCKMTRI